MLWDVDEVGADAGTIRMDCNVKVLGFRFVAQGGARRLPC